MNWPSSVGLCGLVWAVVGLGRGWLGVFVLEDCGLEVGCKREMVGMDALDVVWWLWCRRCADCMAVVGRRRLACGLPLALTSKGGMVLIQWTIRLASSEIVVYCSTFYFFILAELTCHLLLKT